MTVAFTRGDVERMVGTVVVNGTTPVVVAAPYVTSKSVVAFARLTPGGTPTNAGPVAILNPGVGFSVTTGVVTDTSTYNYVVL